MNKKDEEVKRQDIQVTHALRVVQEDQVLQKDPATKRKKVIEQKENIIIIAGVPGEKP
mgnify:FL=1